MSPPEPQPGRPAWWAIERGKHVDLEKPLAHSVWEVRQLTQFAAAKKVATRPGAQRRCRRAWRGY